MQALNAVPGGLVSGASARWHASRGRAAVCRAGGAGPGVPNALSLGGMRCWQPEVAREAGRGGASRRGGACRRIRSAAAAGGFAADGADDSRGSKGECSTNGTDEDNRLQRLWGACVRLVFRMEDNEPLWVVPWHYQTIVKVMMLWFLAFWLVGSWGMPLAAQFIGCDRAGLSYRGQAFYSLLTDISEMTVGLTILYRCLERYMPLSGEWFPVRLKGAWKGKAPWLKDVFWACAVFPLVNILSQINQDLLPVAGDAWPSGSPLELSLTSRDPIANLLYVLVVSVCAPVWEEVIFRGFLLPSLSRYLPIGGSVVVSAVAFALAHFSLQRLLPLFFLGVVMGVVFVRSRNLMASMLLHSLWNGFVFLQLLS